MRTVQVKAHAGLRNDVSSERFSPEDLLIADNIDIDTTGEVFRRKGIQQLSSTPTYSLYSDGVNTYCVRGSQLGVLDSSYAFHAFGEDGGIGNTVVYETVNNITYFSDGTRIGRIERGTASKWGITPPRATLQVAIGSGDLPAGRYGITVVSLRGEMESGAPRSLFVDLPANSGVVISGLPTGTKRLYMTLTDGAVHYATGDYTDSSILVTSPPAPVLPLRTQFKSPPPAGHLLGYYKGRMYVAHDNALFYSDPYEYELFDLQDNYVAFDSPVRIFARTPDGVFVATENMTYFLAGDDPDKFVSTPVLNSGGVQGTLVYPRPDRMLKKGEVLGATALWMAKSGVVLGMASGQLISLTSDRYVMPDNVSYGAGLLKVRSGIPQYLSTLFN